MRQTNSPNQSLWIAMGEPLWIAMGERSGLLTHIAATEGVTLCVRMKS